MKDNNKLSENEINYQNLDEEIARLDSALAKMNDRLKAIDDRAPKNDVDSSIPKKKILVAMVAITMLLISVVVCTYAYFVGTALSGGNIIATGYSDVTLHDITDPSHSPDPSNPDAISIFPGNTVNKTVYVTNNGSYPIYVRAKITEYITLDARYADRQNEIDLSLVSYDIDRNNWTELNGYYYFNTPIAQGESTTLLLSQVKFSEQMGNIYKDSKIVVKVLLEVVQSNSNGETVFDAVGWTSTEEGGVQ